MRRRSDPRFADDRVVDAHDVVTAFGRLACRTLHRVAAPADDRRLSARQPRVAWFWRLRKLSAVAFLEPFDDCLGTRFTEVEPTDHVERICESARIGDRRARSDDAQVVADDVRDGEGARWPSRPSGEPAALD